MADNIDNVVTGGIYAVNPDTKGSLPYSSYGLLFVRRIYDWIYQDLYYTSSDQLWHYHRKRINEDPWSAWFKYITDSNLQPTVINRINIDNEYLSVSLTWCVHLNICYVTLLGLTAKQIADPVVIYNELPKAHMSSHLDFLNKGTGNWFGSGWLDENTSILYCRFRKVDSFGWLSFSYPVRST